MKMVGLTFLAPFGGATGYLRILNKSAMMPPVARLTYCTYRSITIRPKSERGNSNVKNL